FARKITPRTRLVAVGYASNAVGTVNDVKRVIELAHAVGALVYVDAVHYGPHGPIDVRELDADFLACSPYKFFAPHAGTLYGKREHLLRLHPYKVRPASDELPGRWMTGTQSHETMAGVTAAIEYLAELGRKLGDRAGAGAADSSSARAQTVEFESASGEGGAGQAHGDDDSALPAGGSERRRAILAAMRAIREYERSLSEKLIAGLLAIPGLTFYGISDPARFDQRTPTVAVRVAGYTPRQLSEALGERGIFTWDGNYYALNLTERLGVEDDGGMLRIGLVHYNTPDEIDRLIDALRDIVG
ncbi:MAG TPA: aminotransferase class V-fold PLP-dependent enzyme, partial [Roseiflexaceae bacterium]|nr:aminotransferase class V-fold PLP-dependent enzyme [Roseiflexaceae bacterium]